MGSPEIAAPVKPAKRAYRWRTFDLVEPAGGWPEPPIHFLGDRADRADCIEWAGKPNLTGYGQTTLAGETVGAHVSAWVSVYGPIGKDEHGRTLLVCHTCDNPICYNVEHLWLGTASDNNADRDAKDRGVVERSLVCRKGHPYTGANTRHDKAGRRHCRACEEHARRQRSSAKLLEQLLAPKEVADEADQRPDDP